MKIHTEEHLGHALDEDLAWRKRELSTLKFMLTRPSVRAHELDVLLRGAVALLYAHWEGFVKVAGQSYLEFIAAQRLRCDELAPPFLALATRKVLAKADGASRIRSHIEVALFYRSKLHEQSTIPFKDGISTRSNLSSEVLNDIIATLGLVYAPFETKARLIDERLLRTRNTVAHGEYLIIDRPLYEETQEEVQQMMEEFRTQIQNAAALGQFRMS